MANYIDLHNHILPGIDDGPRTMDEAVQLARDLVNAGYSTVVATPHAFEGQPAPQVILERLEELQDELDAAEINLKLLPGSEQHIGPGLLELLEEGQILTLNNTNYLLLELPMLQPLPVYTEQLLFDLSLKGYHPVIPHPERVIALNRNHELLYRLNQAGALYQVTWAALPGLLGSTAQQTVQTMITAKLAHLFATDAHHPTTRLLSVDEASALYEELVGPGSAELMLTTRPGLLLDNQTLDLPEALAPEAWPRKKGSFFSRLRGLK